MKKVLVLAIVAAMALAVGAPFSYAGSVHIINGRENMNDVYLREMSVSTIGVSNDIDYSGTTMNFNNTGANLVMGGDDVAGVTIDTGNADTEINTMEDFATTKVTNGEASANGGSDILIDNCCEEGADDCACGDSEENMNRVVIETDDFKDTQVENEADIEEFDLGVTNAGLNVVAGADDMCDVEVVTGHTTHTRDYQIYVGWSDIER